MSDLHGPAPVTDRDFIVAVYHKLEAIQQDIDELKDVKERMRSLEMFRDRLTFLAFPVWSLLVVFFGAWVKGLFG